MRDDPGRTVDRREDPTSGSGNGLPQRRSLHRDSERNPAPIGRFSRSASARIRLRCSWRLGEPSHLVIRGNVHWLGSHFASPRIQADRRLRPVEIGRWPVECGRVPPSRSSCGPMTAACSGERGKTSPGRSMRAPSLAASREVLTRTAPPPPAETGLLPPKLRVAT